MVFSEWEDIVRKEVKKAVEGPAGAVLSNRRFCDVARFSGAKLNADRGTRLKDAGSLLIEVT